MVRDRARREDGREDGLARPTGPVHASDDLANLARLVRHGPTNGEHPALSGARGAFDTDRLLRLQRLAGNRAVASLIADLRGRRPGVATRRGSAMAQRAHGRVVPVRLARRPGRPAFIQRAHLDIPQSVNAFKTQTTPTNEPPGGASLTSSGQFYWTGLISNAITARIDALATNAPAANKGPWNPVVDDPFGFLQPGERPTPPPLPLQVELFVQPAGGPWSYLIQVLRDVQAEKTTIDDARAAVRMLRTYGNLWPATVPLLPQVDALLQRPDQIVGATAMAKGKLVYYTLWGKLNKDDAVPDLAPYTTFPVLDCVHVWENQACGYTGSMVARRFQQKGGMKTANPDAKRQSGTQAFAVLATSATRDMRRVGTLRRGDVLKQRGVGGVIDGMKRALDDGWVLHARVLSGVDYAWGEYAEAYDAAVRKGRPPAQPVGLPKPPEEHSIMIIGYDGNEFVFWDPDSASSNKHGPGFGALYYADGRLTTAASDADLPVSDEGNHASGAHRYQVILFGSQ